MKTIEKDIVKKLLFYPKKKIYKNLFVGVIKERLFEENIVVCVDKVERNLYDRKVYLFYIRYYFRIPEMKRRFGKHGSSENLIKETLYNGIYSKIVGISVSLENFISAKCFQEVPYAGNNDLYALERGYITNESTFYNFKKEEEAAV